eukprot:TRINITY_DN39999_c0_g1_i1.p1 TRINITY_DN39999_c0_g1~~TRINITY_DN39999_c0_g1_i1.p1  ORF type:complete len:833 (+),score=125.04 TRINITY_DN39999_c0_g1_i1:162-2501(+)
MELARRSGINAESLFCIRNFNCIMSLPKAPPAEGEKVPKKLWKVMRLTQRRSNMIANIGATSEDTSDRERFSGSIPTEVKTSTGIQMNVDRNRLLVPLSGFSEVIALGSGPSDHESKGADFNLWYDRDEPNCLVDGTGCKPVNQFCETVKSASNGGKSTESYGGNGGIVCQLDGDYETFTEQLKLMTDNSFFAVSSAAFAVELMVQNAHRGFLTYVSVEFMMTPAGRVMQDVNIAPVSLFGLDYAVDNLGGIVIRLAPGVIYMALVFVFTGMLYQELKVEHTRRKVNSGPNEKPPTIVASFYYFFSSDIFRIFDALSTVFSFASCGMFMAWLVKEGELATLLTGDFNAFVAWGQEFTSLEKAYNRLSAFNLLLMFVRPLRFMRENPRMQRLNQTLFEAMTDINWFIVVLFVVLIAYMLLAHVSFGAAFFSCSTLPRTFNYCFFYILGHFDFWPLYSADPVMAFIFFFPYLLLFYCVFTNIFFAMVDRFFISGDPPPLNLKRKLKPIFSRICRCIEWDDDFVMQEDPNHEVASGPKSRASRVQETAKAIKAIRSYGADGGENTSIRKSKLLSEVCDTDERMNNVMRWSRDEAKTIVTEFNRLLSKKQEAKSDDQFIKVEVLSMIKEKKQITRREMDEALRQMRYATDVHEAMALRDQQTLARYILLLENKIQRKMIDKHKLALEVGHLRSESDSMRYTKEDLKLQNATGGEEVAAKVVTGDKPDEGDNGDEDSEFDEPPLGKEGAEAEVAGRDPNDASEYPKKSSGGSAGVMIDALKTLS